MLSCHVGFGVWCFFELGIWLGKSHVCFHVTITITKSIRHPDADNIGDAKNIINIWHFSHELT